MLLSYRAIMSTPIAPEDMGRTTISVTDELADELYERKNRGESYEDVVWRALEALDQQPPDDTHTEPQTVSDPAGDVPEEQPSGSGSETIDRPGTPSEDSYVIEDAVAALDLPGSGDKLRQRREAVQAAVDYMREHRDATPSDLKEDIYPRYDGGYASARSWWKNCVYQAFTDLADEHSLLESADTTGVWRWRDSHER